MTVEKEKANRVWQAPDPNCMPILVLINKPAGTLVNGTTMPPVYREAVANAAGQYVIRKEEQFFEEMCNNMKTYERKWGLVEISAKLEGKSQVEKKPEIQDEVARKVIAQKDAENAELKKQIDALSNKIEALSQKKGGPKDE